jgi:hypothetical protein
MSVCPFGTAWLPMNNVHKILVFEFFENILRKIQAFKITQEYPALYMKTVIHF